MGWIDGGSGRVITKIPGITGSAGRVVVERNRAAGNCASESGDRYSIYHHEVGLGSRIAARAVAHRQSYRIRAGRVIDNQWILLGRTIWCATRELPVERRCISRGSTSKLYRQWRTTAGVRRRKVGRRWRSNHYCLGRGAAAAAIRGGQNHGVSSVRCIGMCRSSSCTGTVIAKIPGIRTCAAGIIGKCGGRSGNGAGKGRSRSSAHHHQIGLRSGIAARTVANC